MSDSSKHDPAPDPLSERQDRAEKQTSRNFEHLGRYVQAFEHMVMDVRSGIQMLSFRSAGTIQAQAIMILINHRVMSAQPLFDCFRAITYLYMKELKLPDEDRKHVTAIMDNVTSRYQAACQTRNNILHGTPWIGWYGQEDEDFVSLGISKFNVSKTGIERATTPETTDELIALSDECKNLGALIYQVYFVLRLPEKDRAGPFSLHGGFRREGGKWVSLASTRRTNGQ